MPTTDSPRSIYARITPFIESRGPFNLPGRRFWFSHRIIIAAFWHQLEGDKKNILTLFLNLLWNYFDWTDQVDVNEEIRSISHITVNWFRRVQTTAAPTDVNVLNWYQGCFFMFLLSRLDYYHNIVYFFTKLLGGKCCNSSNSLIKTIFNFYCLFDTITNEINIYTALKM